MAFIPPFSRFFPFPAPDAALAGAINHLLQQEVWARKQLQPHAGKLVRIAMPPFSLCLAVCADGTCEPADSQGEFALKIEVPLAALPDALGHGQEAVMKKAKIEGDVQFAQAVAKVAQHLRWDFEEDLSGWVGDVPARRIVRTAQRLARQTWGAHQRLAANVAEYFLAENQQLVRIRDVSTLTDQVRTLRDDLARLEKRIEKLARN